MGLSSMVPTCDNSKVLTVPFGEGFSNPSMARPESQTVVMTTNILEVEPLAVIPHTVG